MFSSHKSLWIKFSGVLVLVGLIGNAGFATEVEMVSVLRDPVPLDRLFKTPLKEWPELERDTLETLLITGSELYKTNTSSFEPNVKEKLEKDLPLLKKFHKAAQYMTSLDGPYFMNLFIQKDDSKKVKDYEKFLDLIIEAEPKRILTNNASKVNFWSPEAKEAWGQLPALDKQINDLKSKALRIAKDRKLEQARGSTKLDQAVMDFEGRKEFQEPTVDGVYPAKKTNIVELK